MLERSFVTGNSTSRSADSSREGPLLPRVGSDYPWHQMALHVQRPQGHGLLPALPGFVTLLPFHAGCSGVSPHFLSPASAVFLQPGPPHSPARVSTMLSLAPSASLKDFSYFQEAKETLTLTKAFPPRLSCSQLPSQPALMASGAKGQAIFFWMPLWRPAPVWRFYLQSLAPQGERRWLRVIPWGSTWGINPIRREVER